MIDLTLRLDNVVRPARCWVQVKLKESHRFFVVRARRCARGRVRIQDLCDLVTHGFQVDTSCAVGRFCQRSPCRSAYRTKFRTVKCTLVAARDEQRTESSRQTLWCSLRSSIKLVFREVEYRRLRVASNGSDR